MNNYALVNSGESTWTLTLSPNPVQNKLEIQLSNIYGATSISVIDIMGRKLSTQQINISGSNKVNFNTTNLKSALYFIQVTNNNQTEYLKFIKQ